MKQTSIPTHNFSPQDNFTISGIRYVPIDVREDRIVSSPHRHNYYAVVFFARGGGKHIIDFVEHAIPDRSVHLIKPGQVHLLMRDPGAYGAAIHFSKEEAVRFTAVASLLQATRHPLHMHGSDAFASISSMLSLLHAEITAGNSAVASACLSMLLLKCISTGHVLQAGVSAEVRQQFVLFEGLAERHYRNEYAPGWYARQLNITEKKLNNICKEATGTTVSHYLKERVLLEAKRLLSHSAGSIKEIGYYLGFDDPAYFARFFAVNAGITASNFRKLHS